MSRPGPHHSSALRSAARWCGVVAGALLSCLVGVAPAAAHNSLIASSPGDRQTVARTPATVVLTFAEPAIAVGTQIVVSGPAGPVHRGPVRLIDNTVSQDLEPGAPAGAYTVTWRATSADGHPISGVFVFTSAASGAVSSASGTTPPSAASAPSTGPAAQVASTPVRIGAGLLLAGIVFGAAVLTARAFHRRATR